MSLYRKIRVTEAARRIDQFLTTELPDVSRKKAREACERGEVLLNGKQAKPGAGISPGDEIVLVGFESESGARAELAREHGGGALLLDILYQDEALLVVAKPRGMPSVTLHPSDPLTVADCLADIAEETLSASPDSREAGLVQRLDNWTSGILLAAKNRTTWEFLRSELFEGRIRKSYCALVEGELLAQNRPIRKSIVQSSDGKSMKVEGKAAPEGEPLPETIISTRKNFTKNYFAEDVATTLVEARALRAKRHQIRVHLSSVGHPLVGDNRYGAKRELREFFPEEQLEHGEGFLLHAASIAFSHSITRKELSFQKQSEHFSFLENFFEGKK